MGPGFNRHSPLVAALVATFYDDFFPSHPFLIPEKLYRRSPNLLPDHLVAAMCVLAASFVPAPFVSREAVESFKATAARATLPTTPDDGFKDQSLMLSALSEYANDHQATSRRHLDLAVDLALLIGMNRAPSPTAAAEREAPAIVSEMWNRTWWELYFIAGLFSASGSTSSWIRISLAPVDRPLPGRCREYSECLISQNTPSELQFYRHRPPKSHCWSAFAFKVASIHIMAQVLEWQSQVKAPSPRLARQSVQELSLLVSCMKTSVHDIVKCDGRIDEQLFSASIVVHLTRILLSWPEAGDILRKFPDTTEIIPGFMTTASWPHGESIAAAHGIINLIHMDLKLHRRTPFFGLALYMAAILYGVESAQASTVTQSQNARVRFA
ncbi:Fungal specific transcription factor domain-containing protein [Cladophialophora immunda]|nr:Fungal specific transcription factor domain-containing protein [Cladophialophora immunda]